ncbi:hypothetical protein [Lunatibacter salilacus]|uniref:hypothetical protein n=1 Tax=Lunatibacter salilacus TaxID=2483804 RepID=UPI00131BAD68|nr:hypothetical protein [Lunatibacter salilacus]
MITPNIHIDKIDIKKFIVVLMLMISFLVTILITWTRVQFIYINNGPETDSVYMEMVEDWKMAEMME